MLPREIAGVARMAATVLAFSFSEFPSPSSTHSGKNFIGQTLLRIMVGLHLRTEGVSKDNLSYGGSMKNLGSILKSYRSAHALTQTELAARLNCDQTYISKIENCHRTIGNMVDLSRIAERLGLPPQVLGLARHKDCGQSIDEVLELAPSMIELCDRARNAGCASEAIRSLAPLVVKLDLRSSENRCDPNLLATLALAENALATALGERLPSTRLASSVALFRRAWHRVTLLTNNDGLKNLVLRRYGNELRKVGKLGLAVSSLKSALAFASDTSARGASFMGLARAFARMGNYREFAAAVASAGRLVFSLREPRPTFNRLVVEEIRLRGLHMLGRVDEIRSVLRSETRHREEPVLAAQWRAMSSITQGAARLATGERELGLTLIDHGVDSASQYQLPQQIHRAIRYLKPLKTSLHARRLASRAYEALRELSREQTAIAVVTP